MDIKNVDLNLVEAWISTLIVEEKSTVNNFATLMQMTDAEKIVSLTTYLQARSLAAQAQLDTMANTTAAMSTSITADKDACNAALVSVGSPTVVPK